jgi:hypothetical protein
VVREVADLLRAVADPLRDQLPRREFPEEDIIFSPLKEDFPMRGFSWETVQTANPVQTTAIFEVIGGVFGYAVDGGNPLQNDAFLSREPLAEVGTVCKRACRRGRSGRKFHPVDSTHS